MKKLQRIFCLLLATLLLSGTIAQAAVYSHYPDVQDDAEYVEAVNSLAELGIFKGDTNGNFNPNSTITRAEFATIIVRLLGEEDRAKTINTSIFTDVPSLHWACGYITIAVELGLVNGYGNEKFGPSNTLTYEQAVTILLRAWGYSQVADEHGGWPNGYIYVAKELGMTENTQIGGNESVSRSTVAILTYNLLNISAKIS